MSLRLIDINLKTWKRKVTSDMSHRNYRRDPVAKELREDEQYRQRVERNRKKYHRSTKEKAKWEGDWWWDIEADEE